MKPTEELLVDIEEAGYKSAKATKQGDRATSDDWVRWYDKVMHGYKGADAAAIREKWREGYNRGSRRLIDNRNF